MKIRKRAALLLVIICSMFLFKVGTDYYIRRTSEKNIICAFTNTNKLMQSHAINQDIRSSRKNSESPHKEVFGFIGMYLIIARLSEVKSKLIVLNKNRKVKNILKVLRNKDNTYLKENLDDRVRKTYFKVEEAWGSMNLKIASDYMSDNIYNLHKTKTEWMKIRREKYVIENIKLLDTRIIGLEHYNDNSKDVVWFYVKCSMTNYITDNFTEKLINTDNTVKNKKIIEFWKFNKRNDIWVLDEIIKIKDKDKWRDIGVFIEGEK